jgi:DNA-binding transcriptional LysR family regulator
MEPQPQSLIERRVDLLVCRRYTVLENDPLNFETLFESPYVVVAGKNSLWFRRRRVELAELVDEAWALPPPDNSFGPFVVETFRASGLEFPRRTVQSTALEMRANLLKMGRYLAIVPEFWLQFPEWHPFIRKLPIELPLASGPIGVMTLKNRTLSAAAQLFIETAREMAKPLASKK